MYIVQLFFYLSKDLAVYPLLILNERPSLSLF